MSALRDPSKDNMGKLWLGLATRKLLSRGEPCHFYQQLGLET